MVTDFSAAEKARGMKFCMRVGLLSGQVFSPFGGQRSRSPGTKNTLSAVKPHPACVRMVCARCKRQTDERISCRPKGDGVQLCTTSTKAVWWDLHLARLLTHLFVSL